MKFQKGDILVKNNIIWLRQSFVASVCDFTENYQAVIKNKYKEAVQPCYHHHNILPDTKKSWRWAKMNHDYYYALNRIPNRKPNYYRDQFGDADTLLENYKLSLEANENSILQAELTSFINEDYKLYFHEYQNCTPVQRIALAKACSVISFTADYIARLEVKGNKIYQQIAEIIEAKDLRYLPTNYRRFKEKVQEYIGGNDVTNIIKLPRTGNNNALIFDDPELQAAALALRARGENFTNEYIIRKVQELCKIKGRRVPGRRWFGQKVFELNETKFLTDHLRHGFGSRKAFENTGYIPLERALYAGDCWQIDATRMNLIEHKKDDKKNGFLYIVAVKDVHSGDIIGHAFDYSENRYVYANAIKMAVESTGYLPYELVYDRFPGHNTKEIMTLFSTMETMGVKMTQTIKATGKPHVERGFGTLQSVFMQESKYYYGEGILSRRASAHRSPEYLKQIRKESRAEGFDLTASYDESEAIIEAFRSTKLSYYSRRHAKVDRSPSEIHQESEKPNVKQLQPHQISMLFGLKKKATIKHDGMIRTEIQKGDYCFQVSDYEVMKKHKQVILSYDLEDLSQVHLFKPNGDMLIHISSASLFEKPQTYGPQAEFNKIALEKQRLKSIQERKTLDLEEQISDTNEINLLMGRYTNKTDAEEAETNRILRKPYPKEPEKRIANSDIDDSDIDLDSFFANQL